MADSIKCPNCGSNIFFDIEKQKAICAYCLNEYSAEQLESFLNSIEKKKETPKENRETLKKKREALFADGVKFTCNSCGAKLVTERHSVVTYCSYCGSPALISERLSEEFAPDYIIPFKINRTEALNLFTEWCDGGKWTPYDFVSDNTKAKITGIYVPFWLYDTDGVIDISAQGLDRDSSSKYFDLSRKIKLSWENIPVMASPNFNEELMKTIEPFDLENLSDFHPAYLQGFLAECWSEDATEMKGLASARIVKFMNEEFENTVTSKYERIRIDSDRSTWKHKNIHYGLFPVWYLHYEHKGKSYDFAINGQTGKVSGHYPISKTKRLLVFLALFAVTSLVARLIIGALLGGLF